MSEITTVKLQLIFADADPSNPDPALRGTVARCSVDALRSEGYDVKPAYTGQMGGDIYELVMQTAQLVHANQAFLMALCQLSTPIVAFLLAVRTTQRTVQAQLASSKAQDQSVSVTFEIDGKSVKITAPNAKSAAITAAELEARVRTTHPGIESQITPHSDLRITREVQSVPVVQRRR